MAHAFNGITRSNCTDDGMDVPQDLAIVQPSNRANKNNVFLAVATMKGNMYFAKASLSTCVIIMSTTVSLPRHHQQENWTQAYLKTSEKF
jgi:chorismate mutase